MPPPADRAAKGGGKYLLLPPGYKGELPEGSFVVGVPTCESILIWRNFCGAFPPAAI